MRIAPKSVGYLFALQDIMEVTITCRLNSHSLAANISDENKKT